MRRATHRAAGIALLKKAVFNFAIDTMEPLHGTIGSFPRCAELGLQLDNLSFGDVLPAFIKTYFFGFAVGVIGCYKGYTSSKGTEGVGRAANSAVVLSSILIFIIDLIVVQFTDVLGLN